MSTRRLCSILGVSESGYYRWLCSCNITDRDALLLTRIRRVLAEHPDNSNYGVNRIYLALAQKGKPVGKARVRRVMKANGLLQRKKRHPNGITKADAEAQKSENLLKRNFHADMPNTVWLTDITEIPCKDGKLYVAPVLDCFDGKIVGLSMAGHMRAELCIQAFTNACRSENAQGMILHSDRGSQYTSYDFRECLQKHRAKQSMSGTGRCYDNARMESFFATLKKEKLYKMDTRKLLRADVRKIVFRYIMIYYNRKRIYTANPYGWPPERFRASFVARMAA